ncbi:hypothetical protein BKA61DRAFT_663634 [Leptodontidium sp. MPI-SDFR-AT-0119]|nr:hypothetical protein BKA61DRAFT_663634 [Leptodontidium sp. MPI-SDFR-AT-0119]
MSQRSAPKQVIVNALGARYLATPQKAEDMIQEMVENGSLRPDSFGGYILIGPAIMEIVRIYGQSATQAQQPRGPQQQPQQHGGYYNPPQSQPQYQFGPQSHFAPAPQPQLPPPQPALNTHLNIQLNPSPSFNSKLDITTHLSQRLNIHLNILLSPNHNFNRNNHTHLPLPHTLPYIPIPPMSLAPVQKSFVSKSNSSQRYDELSG